MAVILMTAIIPGMAQKTNTQSQTCEQMMGNISGMMNYSRRMMEGNNGNNPGYHSTNANSDISDVDNVGPIGWFNIPFLNF